jgi:hypothetical protein
MIEMYLGWLNDTMGDAECNLNDKNHKIVDC